MIQAPHALTLSETAALRAWFDASDLSYLVDLVDSHKVAPQRLASLMHDAREILVTSADAL